LPTLTHGDAQDLIERYKRAWERRDPDQAMLLYRDDAEFRLDPFEEAARGANEIRQIWNDVAATQDHVEFDAERVWAVGHTVLASWHAAFTQRSSAERIRIKGFSTFELDDDGLIRRAKQWAASRVVGLDSTARPDEKGK
jgi:nuclear transport factor 2 (NTF2) superfamily protein